MFGGGYGAGGFCQSKKHKPKARMKSNKIPTICLIIPSLTLGGAEKQAVLLARFIKKEGLGRPIIIGIGRSGILEPQLKSEKIECISLDLMVGFHLKRWVLWSRAFFFRRKIRALNPDLVIPLTYWPNLLGAFSCWGPGSPICMWNQRSIDSLLPFTMMERGVRSAVKSYASNSQQAADFIRKRHGISASKRVDIIPNIIEDIDLSKIKSKPRSDSTPRILMMANFFKGKRHDLVLNGLKIWEQANPTQQIELIFSGRAPGGIAVENAKALAFDLKLRSKVVFARYPSIQSGLAAGVDVGLLATDAEGYSNSIVEYMLAGVPVLVSDIPSNREVLGKQIEHQLFEQNPAAFAQSLSLLMDQQGEWEQIGKQNRKEILERHAGCAEMAWGSIISRLLASK